MLWETPKLQINKADYQKTLTLTACNKLQGNIQRTSIFSNQGVARQNRLLIVN